MRIGKAPRSMVLFRSARAHRKASLVKRPGLVTSQGIVDLTAGCGAGALACIKAKKPYIGCCLSDTHKIQLEQHILKCIFQEMLKEDSKTPCLELTKAIKEVETNRKEKRPRPGAKPKLAKRIKKTAKTADKEGEDDDDEADASASDKGEA